MTNVAYNQDCLIGMKRLKGESIDCIINWGVIDLKNIPNKLNYFNMIKKYSFPVK